MAPVPDECTGDEPPASTTRTAPPSGALRARHHGGALRACPSPRRICTLRFSSRLLPTLTTEQTEPANRQDL